MINKIRTLTRILAVVGILLFMSLNSVAQNFITVPFTNGFVGRNTANNAADSCYYLFDLGWKDIQFAQYSTADVFVAQGNDIIGMVIITDKNNVRHIINGFIKWRNPSGNSPNTMVFQPSASANSILATQSPYPQNSYLLNDTRYIGLTFNNTTITITGGNGGTISGNAATTGLLTSLNNYLATFPKINVSNADTTFYESDLTATVRVRLSITPTDTIKVKYKTENGTALAGSDFTAKTNDSLIFIPGDTVEFATVNLTNDGVSESPERFVLRLFQPTNASIIRDSASVRILDPLTSSITSQSNISCGANPTLGSATVNPIGGLAPYTYSWSPSGGNSATASGLNAGSYVCTITDSRGRTTTQNVTITVAANWTKLYETTNPSRDGSGSIVYVPGFGKTGGAASSFTGGFNRVRYRLENNISGTLRWAEVSFDAWSGLNAAGLQIPDLVNNLVNQRNVFNIEVNSNMPGVNTGRFDSGRIEMWPHNYVPAVSGILFPSGNGSNYDWDDTRSTSGDHGSFQIHNISSSSRQTILAWNMHRNGGPAEIGLGNAPTGDPDWTFNTSNGSTNFKVQVFVSDLPDVSLVSGNQTQAVCSGSAITPTVYSYGNGATGVVVSNLPAGVTSSIDTTLKRVTISGNPTAAGTYRIFTTGHPAACTADTILGSITINPAPSISTTTSNSRCGAGSVNLSANASAGTVNWFANLTGGTVLFTGSNFTTPSISASTTYYVEATNNGCSTVPRVSVVATINAAPTATATASGSTAICQGGSVVINANTGTGLTYQWRNASGNIPGAINASLTANAAGAYKVVVTNTNGCIDSSAAVSVTVNALPTATATAATSTTFCQGGSVVINANTGTGLTYQWRNSGVNIPLATTSSLTATASGSYRAVVTNTNGCVDSSAAVTVTVVPSIASNTIATSQSILINTAPAQLTGTLPTGGTGSYTYSWLVSTTGATSGFSAIGSTNTQNYSPSVLSQNTWYRRLVASGSCSDTTAAVSITVNANIANNTISAAQTICSGNTPAGLTGLTPSGGTGSFTYTWLRSTTSASTGFSAAPGTNNAQNYTPGALTQTSWYRRYVVSGSASDTSAAIQITVSPVIAANTATGTQSICTGQTPTAIAGSTPTGGSGTYTYSWLSSTTSTTAGYTSATGTNNSQNYAPAALTASTWYRRLVTSGGCSDTSSAASVTVNALPTATATAATATTFCQGGSVVINANTGTGLTYQWRNASGNISGATNASFTANSSGSYRVVVINANGCSDTSVAISVTVNALPTATAIAATSTTFCQGGSVVINANTGTGLTYQWRNASGNIPGATNASLTANAAGAYKVVVTNTNGCIDSSAAVSVTVNALPTATATAATSTTFCQGGSVVINANTGTGLTYQWRNASGNISGATNASLTANVAGAYKVVVTNTNGCADSSAAVSVTVNALPTATATAATSATFCQGGSVVINANTGTGLTYQWRNASGNISGATNASLTANAAGAYKVVVTNTNGCVDSSAAVSVTVNALPTATATAATSTTFCQGGSVVINANTGTGLTYQWRNASGNIPGATNASLTANAAGAYKVVVTNTNGCVDSSAAVSVTVNALPTATATAATATTFCQGDSVVINANTGTGLTYQWRNAGINIPLATSSNFKATASGSYRVVVTNTNGCLDSSSAIIVTVNSIPSISSVTSASRCGNGTIVLGATASAGIVNWYTSITGGISVGTGTSFTTPAINATTTYYVDASNNGCTTATRSSVVATVNPNLTASVSINASTTSVCGSSPITFTATPTNGGTNPTYQWKLNGNNVGTGGTSYILSNPVVGDSVNVVMTSNATPCLLNSTANAIGIKLNNSTVTPSVSIVSNQGSTVCAGASVTFTATALNGGTTPSFQWYRNNIAVGTNASTYITTLLAQGDSIRVALTSNAACLTTSTAQSNILVMTVNNLPSITAQPILQRIITGSQANFSVTATNANTYQWQSSNGGSFSNLTNGSVYSGVSTASLTILNSAGLNNTLYRVVTTNTCGNRQSDSVPLFINTKPLALNDTLNVAQGKSDSVAVLLNDTDPDGQLFNPVIIVGPINGTAVVLPSGKIQYTPGANYYGLDTITYRVCDNGNPIACDTARVFIRINAKPIASRDTISVNEDDSVIFNVRLNDLDPDGTLSNPVIINPPANGTIIILPNGNIKFKPNPNFFGLDSFMYRVCDNGMPVICDSAWVRLIVNSVNDGPDAVNDSININEDDSVIINVRINDTDIDGTLGNPITITNPINGTISILPNGNIKYIPNPDYFGLDSFMYRVCDNGMPVKCDSAWVRLIINPVNDGPDAVNDSININEDDSVIINVRINDTDIDGTLSNPIAITNPRNGTISILPNGNIKYIPNPNYFGLDSFMYRVCDNGMPVKCDSAWVRLIINSVNDGPDAEDDSLTVNENNPVILDLRNNDKDIDGSLGNPVILVGPLNGSAVINPNGTVTYTPKPNYNGVDSFMYRVCDNGIPVRCDSAWVRIKINPVNTAPNAIDDTLIVDEDNAITTDLRNNDIDLDGNLTNPTIRIMPKHGIVVVNNDGLITYTPTADYFGLDSFFYQVCDNGTPVLCDSAWVRITVRPVNDSPNAINDTANTNVNIPVSIAVLLNDVDKDGTINNPIIITNPTSGVAVVNANGTITYTPANGFVGTISFSYRVCDNGTPARCDSAWATVNVLNNIQNLPPIALNDTIKVIENSKIKFDVRSNDIDPDTNGLGKPIAITQPKFGTIQSTDDSNFIYVPFINYTGTDKFSYSISDLGSPAKFDTAEVIIEVSEQSVKIPDGFSPDGDGVNDRFVIPGIEKYPNNKLTIVNRWGEAVYVMEKYNNSWGGEPNMGFTLENGILPAGAYFYILETGTADKPLTGSLYINK